MIVEFRIKNFRSFKDEANFSLVASKRKELEKNIIKTTQPLLKSAAIYGANASGKSNLLKALATMKDIVLASATKLTQGSKIPVQSYLFSSKKDEKSEFEITFIYQGIRYQYGFAVSKEKVFEEWLFAFETNKPQKWFHRVYDEKNLKYEWYFGSKFKGEKSLWKNSTRDNALFLSTAVLLNSQQLKPVFDWFLNKLRIIGIGGLEEAITLKLIENNKNYKEKVLQYLKVADFDIEDIEVDYKDFSPEDLPKDMPSELKEELIKNLDGKRVMNKFESMHLSDDGNLVALDFDEESDGTKKFFALLGPCIDVLEKGYILVIDELNNHLHPLLVKFIVELFHSDKNKNGAQLIFTTHETSILKQDIFRRDQIWFCQKEDQASSLYSLLEFKPRKDVEDLEKGYLSGRYGGLPYIQKILED